MRDIITEQEELAEEEMINEFWGLAARGLLSGAGRQAIKKYGQKGLSFLQNFMKGAKNPKAKAVAGADSTAGMTPTTFVKAGTGTMARAGNKAGKFVGRNKGTLATTAATTGLAAGIDTDTATPMDAGEFAGTTPTPMDAGEFAGTSQPSQLAKPKKDLDSIVFPSDKKLAQQKLDKYDDRAMRLARQNKGGKEAFADPSTLRDTVKVGRSDRARGARGQDMTRANAVAQADAKFKANTPVAKTSKYPKGDIRNLGKYIKPANVTNQGGKKMSGDVEPQKKGADLRNLLKLAGVNRPDGSAKDNK